MPDQRQGAHQIYFYVGRAVHPFYHEQLQAVPDGFVYQPSHPDLAAPSPVKRDLVGRTRVQRRLTNALKRAGVLAAGRTGYIRRVCINPPMGIELTHSAQILPRMRCSPHVIDFEHIDVFSLYEPDALQLPWARARLIRSFSRESCRYLLPWTDAARDSLVAGLGADAAAELAEKTVTVLPSIRPRAGTPRQHARGAWRVLFVGSAFLGKGGVEAVLAARRLREAYDVQLDLVSFPSRSWRRWIREDDVVRVHAGVGRRHLDELFESAHVLLFPAHIDTLGFVVMEALAAALPVVASDHFALPELVEHGTSGLLFPHENSLFGRDGLARCAALSPSRKSIAFRRALASPTEPYVSRIASTLARVFDDGYEYERLSLGALERVTSGALSVERRRGQLRDLYCAALR